MWKFAASLSLSLVLAAPANAVPIQMENTDVRDFVRWYAEHRNIDISFAPGVEGSLTVYAEDVPNADLDTFVDGVLEANGFEILPGNPPILAPLQGTPDDFTQQLDVPQVPQATTVLELRNVRADDVADLVTTFLNRTGQASPNRAHAQVIQAANALLVTGPAERIADLRDLLPRVDVRHPQVLIQAVIFETTAGDTLDLGVSFGTQGPTDVAGGFNTRNLTGTLSLPGGAFGIFDGDTLALAVNALQRNSHARVLSTPQLLSLSGRPGRISVGQNVPIITGRITGEAADIANPFQTIERKDVGVTLAVTPVVTASGLIVMDVQTTADSLTDSLEAADIITNQRRIDTTVQIQSGQTVLLGGLVSEDTTESVSQVPLLGSVPVLGHLFRSTSTSTERRKLYVLLQATEVTRHDA